MQKTEPNRLVRFGVFELDPRSGELRSKGSKVKLQDQPLQILLAMLEKPGDVVTREELRAKLWPADTFVDFDHGLNAAVKRLRDALGDTADNPRYIETLPRHGYRFIAATVPEENTTEQRQPLWKQRGWLLGAAAVLVLAGVVFGVDAGGLRRKLLSGSTIQPQIRSLAVLPLTNLSGDPQQEYFADGMTEMLITNLGMIRSVRVISRTSAMHYKGTRKPLPEIAHELNVDAVVEGTVLRSGDKVRITANLLDGRTDRHLWGKTYESALRDVMVSQSDAAQAIASEIRVKIAREERLSFASVLPVNAAAQDAYLRGRHQWDRRTEESLKNATEYFQKSIELDPGYAPAYAGLADTYAILGDNGFRRPKDVFPLAKAAAVRALEIQPSLAEAHTSLGSVMKAYEWDWEGAEREFKQAIALNPNYSTAHQFYGELLESLGRFDEAVAELKGATQLDPLAPRIYGILAWTLYLAGRYDEGIAAADKSLEVDPYHAGSLCTRGMIYLQKGKYEEAMADLRQAHSLLPGPYYPYLGLVRGYVVSGKQDEARKALKEMEELSRRRYVMPSVMAIAYSGLGDKEGAFTWLEKAYEDRDPWLGLSIKSEPAFDCLRSDPRFQDLLRRMNFPK